MKPNISQIGSFYVGWRRWGRHGSHPENLLTHPRTVDKKGPPRAVLKKLLGTAPKKLHSLCGVLTFSVFLLIRFTSLCKWCWQETHDAWAREERESFPNGEDTTSVKVQSTYISAKCSRVGSIITPCTRGAKAGGSPSNGFQKRSYPRSWLTSGNLRGGSWKNGSAKGHLTVQPPSVPSRQYLSGL